MYAGRIAEENSVAGIVAGFYPRLWVRHQTRRHCLPVVHLRRAVMLQARSAASSSRRASGMAAARCHAGIRENRCVLGCVTSVVTRH